MQPEQQQRIMGYFIEEAKDHLNTIEQGLLNLQSTIDDPEMVNEVFRAAHSVKGGAAMLGLSSIQQTSHRLEDFFKILKESSGIKPDQKLESLLLRVFDTLQELLEQLQGPFGLVEETANATVASVEPVFVELQNHLNQLVTQSGSQLASFDEDTVGFSALPPRVESQALRVIFQDEVSVRLREMLQLFKQAELLRDGRAQLQASCIGLNQLGQRFNLHPWCELVEIARQAIADPDNSYRVLAPVIIRDLKQAQNLVLEGQGERILPSQQLRDLLPLTGTASLTPNDEFADFFAMPNGLPATDDRSAVDLEFAGLTDSASELNVDASLFDETALAASDFAPVDRVLSDRNGPEVGIAELNSLADLFEGEMPELGATWQEEVVVGNTQGDAFSDFNSANFQETTDFSDLLNETAPRTPPSQTAADNLESLFSDDDLFGDDLLTEVNPENLTIPPALEVAAELSELDLADFSVLDIDDLDALNLDDFADRESRDDISLTNLEPPSVRGAELGKDLDNLGELFSGLDDTDLGLSDPSPALNNPLSDDGAADLALGELDFDSLMLGSDDSDETALSGLEAFANSTLPTGDDLNNLPGAVDNLLADDAVVDPWQEDNQLEATPQSLADREFAALDLTTGESDLELLGSFPGTTTDDDDLLFDDLFAENTAATDDSFGLDRLSASDSLAALALDDSSNLGGLDSPLAMTPDPDRDENLSFANLFDDSSEPDLLGNPVGSQEDDSSAAFADLFGDSSESDLFSGATDNAPTSAPDLSNLTELGLGETTEGDFWGLGDNFDLNLEDTSAIETESGQALNLDAADLSTFGNTTELSDSSIFTESADLLGLTSPDHESTDTDLDDLLGDDFNPEADWLAGLAGPANHDQGVTDRWSDSSGLSLEDEMFGISPASSEAPDLNLDEAMFGLDFSTTDEATTDLDLAPESGLSLEDEMFGISPASPEAPDLSLDEAMFGLDFSTTDEATTDLDLAPESGLSLEDEMFGVSPASSEAPDLNLDDAMFGLDFSTTDEATTNLDLAPESGLSLEDEMFGISPASPEAPDLNLDEAMFGLDFSTVDEATADRGVAPESGLSLEDEMFGQTSAADVDLGLDDLDNLNLSGTNLDTNVDEVLTPAAAFELDAWSNQLDDDVVTDSATNNLDLGSDLDIASSVLTNEGEFSLDFLENPSDADFDDLFGTNEGDEDDFSLPVTTQLASLESEMAFPLGELSSADDFADEFEVAVILEESDSGDANQNLGGLGAGLIGAAGLAAGAFALGRAPHEQADADAIDALADGFDELDDLLADDTPETSDLAASDEFSELDDLLSEPTSGAVVTDPLVTELGEFDARAAESPTAAEDEFTFAGLDALLAEETPPSPTADYADFSDLEALLADAPEAAVVTTQIGLSNGVDSEFDDLERMLEDADMTMGGSPTIKNRSAAPSGRRPSRPGKVFSEQTMRVPVKHLDNLSNLVGELVVNRNSLEQDQERLRQSLDNLLYQVQQLSDVGQRMQDLYERSLLESSLLASRQNHRDANNAWRAGGRNNVPVEVVDPDAVEYDPLEMDRFTGFHSLSQEMIELIVRVRESASDIEFIVDETDQVTRMFRQVTTQLQEGLTRSRMVPFAQTADRLPRAVRDIAVKCGKQAELVIEGRETLIDKMILEHLYDPMTHLVNNALTHGIETPDIRQAGGKQALGRITIRAFHQGNQTVISVSDDGAGIDIERVRMKAIEKGLITPAEARTMTKLDLYDLLFHPGFTTKDQADDFAGRGVGMDVVRTSLSEIRGAITTDSSQGKGTTFTIRLPLTLSISKALCCISDRARIAFPMDGVEDMLDIPKERVQTNAEGQPCLAWRDAMLPLRPLTELLGYNRHLSRGNVYGGNQEDDMVSVVILRSAGNYLALEVDQVLGEQEIVIKQLEGPIPKPIGVAGATVLGDGRIMPIADVLELIDLSMGRIRRDVGTMWDQGGAALPDQPIKTEPTVLIVDDSITVRELLSMTFNKVGYRVEQARDGQEAWEKLRAGLPCDIVFCDIEMPRMDGLELLSRIQKDPNLSHLPIAMLTSRGADRHRQMASSLGASGYFTKPYLEEALLDAAQRMLKGEVLMAAPRERE